MPVVVVVALQAPVVAVLQLVGQAAAVMGVLELVPAQQVLLILEVVAAVTEMVGMLAVQA
jgi:hypothetical protein